MNNPQRKIKQTQIMFSTNSFDPLNFIEQYKLGSQNESEKIKKRKQIEGEAIAKAIKSAQDDSFGRFATKDDLKILEVKLEGKFNEVEGKFNAMRKDMQIMEKNLTIKIAAIIVAALGFFQLLAKIFV